MAFDSHVELLFQEFVVLSSDALRDRFLNVIGLNKQKTNNKNTYSRLIFKRNFERN